MRDQGTFIFLFTDMEGSTPMVRRLAERWPGVLAAHRHLIATAVTEAGGDLAGSEGDGHLAVFSTADRALTAAFAGQQALDAHDWPGDVDVRVRMGLHAGVAEHREGDWVGLSLHIAARVCDAANGGQILLSAEAASLVERALPPDARLEDRGAYFLKGLGDPVHLIELRHPALRGEGRPLRAEGTTLAGLPTPLTSFVGRDVELAELVDLVGRHRIVTVTGAGGAGKTRLALEAARSLQTVRPWFVELAPLRDPHLVTNAIAAALGLWQDPSRPLIEAVAERLGAGEARLVLDNCEHLLGACRDVTTALLHRCPGLQVLATSREPLGLPGEVIWRAPSLDLPGGSGTELEASGAGRLFLDRARSADAHLVLSGADRSAVVEICARLDGIPLALELAAARVRALRPTQIADRLDDVFRVLGSGPALERQQTLRATIDWSYELLTTDEKTLLRRLAVFAASFDLEAAEAVAGGDEAGAVLDALAGLVDKSLLQVEPGRSGARYRLLDTVRQYATERLVAAGEGKALRDAHLAYVIHLAEQAEPRLNERDQVEWLDRLGDLHDDARGALAWAEGRPAEGRRVAAAYFRYWFLRGHLAEGLRWLAPLVPADDHAPTVDGMRVLYGTGVLMSYTGRLEEAEALIDRVLAMARRLGSTSAMASALCMYNATLRARDDRAGLRAGLEEAVRVARLGDPEATLNLALNILGQTRAVAGELEEAEAVLSEAVVLARRRGDRSSLGLTGALMGMAFLHEQRGDEAAAREALTEALDAAGELGDVVMSSGLRIQLAQVHLQTGEEAAALALAREALDLARRSGRRASVAMALAVFAVAAGRRGQPVLAARLLGAADAHGLPWWQFTQRLSITTRDELRAGLGPRYAAMEAEGGAMDREQLDELLAEVDP